MKFLQNFISAQTLLKQFRFQVKHIYYIKENPNYISRTLGDFRGAFVRSKKVLYLPLLKSLPEIVLMLLEPVDLKLLQQDQYLLMI